MLKIEIQRVQQQWIAEAINEGISMWNPKFNVEDDGDRISNLPESVLCHILSLLQAKDAVRTCVLSKAWEYKWIICLYNLKFDDSLSYTNQQTKKKLFANFVDRTLAHCTMSMAKEFELLCKLSSYDPSRVKLWISALLLHNNFERLHVSYREHGMRKLELPCYFHTCDSLTEVRLCRFNLKFPPIVCLPKLRILHLRKIGFLNRNLSSSLSQLVLSFPVLESFHLEDYKGLDKVKTLKIDAHLLANFLMLSNHCSTQIRTNGVAKLKKFKCSGLLFHKFVWSSASPSGAVNISIKHTTQDNILVLRKFITFPTFRLLQKLSASVTILELPAHVVEVNEQTSLFYSCW
ncbi:F-box protein At4g09920-like [Coffea arabica]|uniref:F-box protein At4g09920-like n=1 Tax=Coffea arabica TaxID=13443 RepID=A0A6P6S9Z0_COFAR|nr:putative F-box/FBD/LRR-repeat protein At1g78760 [Coffea arabica]